jgi:hypothetical protein
MQKNLIKDQDHYQYPVKWEILKKFHRTVPIYSIDRHHLIENKYKEFRQKKTRTIEQYLMNMFDKNQNKFRIMSWFRLIPCDFPYNVEKGIDHWILWINPKNVSIKYTKKEVEKIIKNYMEYYSPLFKYFEYIFFENSVKNQSIKQIKHYHIFFR